MMDTPFDYLTRMNLTQIPPCVRTVMYFDVEEKIDVEEKTRRLSFPWITFGKISYQNSYHYERNVGCFPCVFFHNTPWRDLAHAQKILCQAPEFFHAGNDLGTFCPGFLALERVAKGKITAADAFWMTLCSNGEIRPKVMIDIEHPERVLKHPWRKISWSHFLDTWKNWEKSQGSGFKWI